MWYEQAFFFAISILSGLICKMLQMVVTKYKYKFMPSFSAVFLGVINLVATIYYMYDIQQTYGMLTTYCKYC